MLRAALKKAICVLSAVLFARDVIHAPNVSVAQSNNTNEMSSVFITHPFAVTNRSSPVTSLSRNNSAETGSATPALHF
jgi:hypothetical protein